MNLDHDIDAEDYLDRVEGIDALMSQAEEAEQALLDSHSVQPDTDRGTDDRDVHTEHCCADHGCCYNDSDCTVVTGQKPASFPCEVCDYITREIADFIPALSDDQLIAELRRRGFDLASLT